MENLPVEIIIIIIFRCLSVNVFKVVFLSYETLLHNFEMHWILGGVLHFGQVTLVNYNEILGHVADQNCKAKSIFVYKNTLQSTTYFKPALPLQTPGRGFDWMLLMFIRVEHFVFYWAFILSFSLWRKIFEKNQ